MRNQTKTTDANQCTLDEANCNCNNPAVNGKRPDSYALCIYATITKQTQNDAKADDAYKTAAAVPPAAPGSNYALQFSNDQAANQACQTTIAKDAITETGCFNSLNATFNGLEDAAYVVLNAARAKADKEYNAALKDCGGG